MAQLKLLDVEPNAMLSRSDEFYTPPSIMAWVGKVDLDPCAEPARRFPATQHIVGCEGGDGLSEVWGPVRDGNKLHIPSRPARVFCNPPYNRDPNNTSQLERWVSKCAAEYKAGRADPIIALIPFRPSESYWWGPIFGCARAVFAIRGRVRFCNSAGTQVSVGGTFASCLVIWGDGTLGLHAIREIQRRAGDNVQLLSMMGAG